MTSHRSSQTVESAITEMPNFEYPLSTLPSSGQIDLNATSSQKQGRGQIAASNQSLFDTSADDYVASPTFPITRLADIGSAPASRTELLAEWDGCVTGLPNEGYYFSATLKGKVGEGVQGEEEDASIPLDDVSEGDKDLLRLGNFFRLCVIHEVLPTGQPRRYTQVVFRRMPAYRRHDLEQSAERGREIARRLRVE